MTNPLNDFTFLVRNVADQQPSGALKTQLEQAAQEGRKLRIKMGMDPTAPDLHLGHVVVLQKLREFQDLGHKVVLIIGDYTARVGDPTGKSATRPVLSIDQIDLAAETYRAQATKVLKDDPDLLEVRRNSEWLDMGLSEFLELARIPKVAQLLERDDFEKRYKSGKPISLLEFIYPLLQGYDSVAVDADVEVGGTDQLFNLLFGRDVQRARGHSKLQSVLTLPLLTGIDGVDKMSKSLGNHIGISQPPSEIFGRTLRISDPQISNWSELLGVNLESDVQQDPREAKRELARLLVDRFSGQGMGDAAQAEFDKVFINKEVPSDIPVCEIPPGDLVHLPEIISLAFGLSRSEARRQISQGAVRLNSTLCDESTLDISRVECEGAVLQVGKRKFAKLA